MTNPAPLPSIGIVLAISDDALPGSFALTGGVGGAGLTSLLAGRLLPADAAVVLLRTGIVLGPDGGALIPMLLAFRLFAGGPLGSGREWFPWIHRDDVLSIIEFCLARAALSGPVIVSAPEPVTMAGFCATLGSVLRRPSWLPVPTFALRLLFGETSALVLEGQKIIPARLKEHGFAYRFPNLEQAQRDILR